MAKLQLDIIKLLSSDKRDFLIRNNGQKVKIDSLNGKFVVVLYMHYPKHRNVYHPLGLLEAYKTLYAQGDFEVVFVAFTENDDDVDKEDSHQWFNKYFLNMPWLAVPFSDIETRKRVFVDLRLPLYHYYNCAILDKLGNVIHTTALHQFDIYTGEWYPFTYKRIYEIDEERYEPLRDLSLEKLLSSDVRDYVLTNNGDKVLIADLKSKVVGLYFYDRQTHGEDYITIRSIYDKLKAKYMDFEIVFINQCYRHGYPDEESFNKIFEKMPWLALPFGDITCEKLGHTLGIDYWSPSDTSLVIIKSGVFCQLFGLKVIEYYGLEAYPFALENAAALDIEKRSLFSLFDAEGQEFVIQNDNNKTKIKVSKLKGKSVCMLVTSNVPFDTLSLLINWYTKMKRMDDQFEMIYVSRCESVTEFDDILKQMPSEWLALPFGAGREMSRTLRLFGKDNVMLAAFKPDGTYVTKAPLKDRANRELLSNINYPYNVEIDNVGDVSAEIVRDNLWY